MTALERGQKCLQTQLLARLVCTLCECERCVCTCGHVCSCVFVCICINFVCAYMCILVMCMCAHSINYACVHLLVVHIKSRKGLCDDHCVGMKITTQAKRLLLLRNGYCSVHAFSLEVTGCAPLNVMWLCI